MMTLSHIHKTFHAGTVNENKSLRDLTLSIAQGDFVTIIGSNGAGKSTLMNILAGSLSPDSGSIHLDGRDITASQEHERARWIGRVFQDPLRGTASQLTIEENFALSLKRGQARTLSRAVKASYGDQMREELARLGLGLEHRLQDPIGLLSGGQRQSITLLMATVFTPKLLLLDEHTAALDPKTAKTVMALTQEIISKQNLTALMITHNLEQALHYGNRLVMLHKGRVAFDLQGDERLEETKESLFDRFQKVIGEPEDF